MKFAKLKKLWENGVFVGDCDENFAIIACDQMKGDTPKYAWLKRDQDCCTPGINYTLTMVDPEDDDALIGLWIVTEDGHGVLVDAADADELLAQCEACCDGDPVVFTTTYTEDGVSTFPDITGGTTASYCVTRTDDGSPMAQRKFGLDYLEKILTWVLFSANGTTSKYTVTSKTKPVPILTDTVGNANVACT